MIRGVIKIVSIIKTVILFFFYGIAKGQLIALNLKYNLNNGLFGYFNMLTIFFFQVLSAF